MKTTTTRSITAEERARIEGFLSPTPARSPGRLLGFLMAVPVGFTAFVLLSGLLPAAGAANAVLALAATAGSAWLFGRWATDRHAAAFRPPPEDEDRLRKDLAEGRALVTRYDAEAFVKVAADPRRFVATTWFARLSDGAVVLLVGPHFGEAEEAEQFPATGFEVASGESSGFVLSVRRLGERLSPLLTRAPLSDAEWEEIGEDDDEKVPLGWSEILEGARRNPVQVRDAGTTVPGSDAESSARAPAGAREQAGERPIRPT